MALFALLLGVRFALPFWRSPFDRIASDMSRHWAEGARLFQPDFWAAADPKLYQLWMFGLRFFTHDSHFAITLLTALLCVSMAVFWYLACLEMFPKAQAVKLACLIAACPSTLFIYSYFMNETLMLSMIALGVWLTLRAVRVQTFKSSFWAGVCLILMLFVRASAIPVAALCAAYLGAYFPRRFRLFFVLLPVFVFSTMAAAWHSHEGMNIYAPFHFSGIGQVDYYAAARNTHLIINGRDEVIGAPVMRDDPFWPFFHFQWRQKTGDAYFRIDLANGRADWEKAVQQGRSGWNWVDYVYYRTANFLLFFAGPSWPDGISRPMDIIHGADKTPADAISLTGSLARWIWPVLIVMVCFYGWRTPAPRHQSLMLLIALALCLLMGVASPAIFDGRFRKALEPFLIVGAWIICHRYKKQEHDTLTPLQLPLRMLHGLRAG